MFNSGYHFRRNLFSQNLGAIFGLAFVGTFISIVIITIGLEFLQAKNYIQENLSTMEMIAFSALISSTDPVAALAIFGNIRVEPQLLYIVLGESLLNDSIAITVFKTASKFIGRKADVLTVSHLIVLDFVLTLVLSILLGYMCGLLCALGLKKLLNTETSSSTISVCLIMLSIWLPFLLSETLQLSGIVVALFAGMSTRRYASKNISQISRIRTSFVMSLCAHCAESATFLLIGLSVCGQHHQYLHRYLNFGFFVLLVAVLARAMHVYPILSIVNFYRSCRHRITNTNRYKQEDAISKSRTIKNNPLHHIHRETVHEYQRIETSRDSDERDARNSSTPRYIPSNIMHMVFASGLRGAVSIACSNIFPNELNNRMLVMSSTFMIVCTTLIFQGSFTVPLVKFLRIATGVSKDDDNGQMLDNNQTTDFEKSYLYPLFLNRKWTPSADSRFSIDSIDYFEDYHDHGTESSGGGSIYHDSSRSYDKNVSLELSMYQHRFSKQHKYKMSTTGNTEVQEHYDIESEEDRNSTSHEEDLSDDSGILSTSIVCTLPDSEHSTDSSVFTYYTVTDNRTNVVSSRHYYNSEHNLIPMEEILR